MVRTCCLAVAAVAAVASAACHKDEANAKPSPAIAPAPAPPPASVQIFVDDQPVGKVAFAQLGTWPRLDTLVPVDARRMGKWDDVYLKGKGPKPTELHKPSDTYPELVPALFLAPDNTASFGMFDPVELAKHGKPQVREDGVSEVRIKLAQGSGRGEHESGEGGGSDPSKMKIAVKTPKGESVLEGTKLLAIQRTGMPGDASNEPRGWPLKTILGAVGIAKFEKLVLTDASGLSLTLDRKDFDDKTSIPYVKLNRQGALRVVVFKKHGEGWQRSGDLRGLDSIEVLK
ncbi:MAG: hypothetical protein ACM31C_23995 [Acidobacteriota bacterium]